MIEFRLNLGSHKKTGLQRCRTLMSAICVPLVVEARQVTGSFGQHPVGYRNASVGCSLATEDCRLDVHFGQQCGD